MERVLLNKIEWMSRNRDWEIVVVTTDQNGRAPFYQFPEGVRLVDLGINYTDDKFIPLYKRIPSYIRKRSLHRRRLTELLMQERPDITVSLYPSESSFIPSIKDGSRKILELHFNRYFRLQYGRTGLTGLLDRLRSRTDSKLAGRFDRFVVLTDEDRGYWGSLTNIEVIPNAALISAAHSNCTAKRVIAVGRLDYQKSFDRLIDVWAKVRSDKRSEGWTLDIFGRGEWKDMLADRISQLGLTDSVTLNAPTDRIADEYATSSMLVMTSHYEGFPMVMIEAMSAGLPVVTFDYKCGPRDIITHNSDGLIVSDGDSDAMAESILALMSDDSRRAALGKRAMSVADRFSEERVMQMWMNLFEKVLE
ncbi:MAG: glycosyltransferase family 4 protein [Bacteroidales bacterium]|nr:glycosyltransferase family 4 protein [Bacteroidales bacterium]